MDLVDRKKELALNQRDMKKQIERDKDLIQKLSAEIRSASRRNFELEKNLSVLDKQIQLLIQNMISLAELNDMSGGVFTQQPTNQKQIKSPLLGKIELYEQLFRILQKEPKYLAAFAKHVKAREVNDYVKTVLFDMYGDQYDSREERLLFKFFQIGLKQSFDEAQHIESFLRANTAITQMLSAYARRGQGLCILREILEKPIREMVAQTSLNLEINPVEVYKQIVNSFESKMNKPWDGIRNPTSDEAAENKYVKRLIPPRVKQLEYIAEHFIKRIIETVDSVPFGIRWICKQLAEMAQQRFPEADRYQIGGLVCGYIYLRFFNPVVVTPESVHFVDKKVSKTMRRNLILVAKILQNLSNGVEFRDKFMYRLSLFIKKHRKDMQTYFERLIDVKCNLLEDTQLTQRRDNIYTVQISLNQIFLVHRLLLKHRNEWNTNNGDDPVLRILEQLGPAPHNLKHSLNHSINMRLSHNESSNNEIRETKTRADKFHLKVIVMTKVSDAIMDHANYLQTKLQYYQKFLENVKYNHNHSSKHSKCKRKSNKNTIGLSVGGAKDVSNFRKCIEQNIMPSINSLTYEGVLYEYKFDTLTVGDLNRIHEQKVDDSILFYPTYCYAKTKQNNEYEYYITVGLNSNICQDDFHRKHLHLMIVLDKSGSMGQPFNNYDDTKTKMSIANEAVVTLLKHLTDEDRFGLVTFNNSAQIIQPLNSIKNINENILKNKILNINAGGGTTFEQGYNKAIELYTSTEFDLCHPKYENRIIILTDAQPNVGNTTNGLLHLMKTNASNKNKRIYTTIIGVGLDFNSKIVDTITTIRGCNYYTVNSSNEFIKKMENEFEYMVTPLVFNVLLKLKCEGNACKIDKVYGANDININNGEITRIDTLFPSNRDETTGEIQGGILLIKLKKLKNKSNINATIEVSYEDRNEKEFKNEQTVTFRNQEEKVEDMIQLDDDELECHDVDNGSYYDNNGIRKGILLCKYIDILKEWIEFDGENKKLKQLKVSGCGYGKPVKFNHKELVKQNVIVDVDEQILKQTKANFNNLVYYFSQIGPDEFEVEVKYRVGFGAKISPFPEPFHLSLSKLLEMREAHQSRYQLEMVTFQVHLLINLLNKPFVFKGSTQFDENNNGKLYELKVSQKYKNVFVNFKKWFQKEMKICKDDALQKEVDILNKLINIKGKHSGSKMVI